MNRPTIQFICGLICALSARLAANETLEYKCDYGNFYPSNLSGEMRFVSPSEIWIFDTNIYAQRISLATGQCENLATKFRLNQFYQLRGDGVIRDTVDTDTLWIRNTHPARMPGVIKYSLSTSSATLYLSDIASNGILPATERVWIWSDIGLFAYNRNSSTLTKIDKYAGKGIASVTIAPNDALLVNGTDSGLRDFEAAPPKELSDINRIAEITSATYETGACSIAKQKADVFRVECQIPWSSVRNEDTYAIWDGNYLFFMERSYVARIDTKNKTFSLFPAKNPMFITRGNKIWILDGDKIVEVSKDSNRFQSAAPMLEVRDIVYQEFRNLNVNDQFPRLARLFALLTQYPYACDEMGCTQLLYHIKHILRIDSENLAQFEQQVLERKDPAERALGYYILATSCLIQGDPIKSLHYYNLLKSGNPDSILLSYIGNDRIQIETTATAYKNILESRLPPDERLWKLAELFSSASAVDWNRGEVFYNTDYPDSLYKELFTKYPNSQYADNAEYHFLRYLDFEEEVVELSHVDEYKKFIAKYPRSELRPDAELHIAEHYARASQEMPDSAEQPTYSSAAKEIYENILKLHPNSDYAKRATDGLNSLQGTLSE